MSEKYDHKQRMLEYLYGLLSEDEVAEVEEQITSDPEMARAYADARQEADLVAQAARVEAPPLQLKKGSRKGRSTDSNAPTPGEKRAPVERRRSDRPRGRLLDVIAVAAVAVLVCVTGYTYLRPDSPVRTATREDSWKQLADEHLRMIVTGPSQLQTGAPSYFTVQTTAMDGRPVAADVEVALYTRQGKSIFDRKEKTDETGQLQIDIPADLKVANDARLEIRAVDARGAEHRLKTYLPVEPPRYATQLSLDKPLYRPGETVYYRSLTLSRYGMSADREFVVDYEIQGPDGSPLPSSTVVGATTKGVGNGVFPISPDLPGGAYKLIATSQKEEFPAQEQEFFIRQYRPPRLKKELEFLRDSYGPGDVVEADLKVERAEGGAVADAPLNLFVTVDGENVEIEEGDYRTASDGTFRAKFTLPEEIETGAATLAIVVDDGANRETAAKTIPIVLGRVDVEFYPEGGDMAADLQNRVYFFAHDPLGNPVHIQKARVLDSRDNRVAELKTGYEGRGAFRFTPKEGETYSLAIDEPQGLTTESALPTTVSDRWLVLDTGDGVFEADEPIEFGLRSSQSDKPLMVAAVCRGVEVGQLPVVTQAVREGPDGPKPIFLPVTPDAAGVVRLTVFDFSGTVPKPIAERLVYRKPAKQLTVQFDAKDTKFTPGDVVELPLRVTDENGKPVAAAVGASVVNSATLSLADDKTPQMPSFFYLATEIEKPQDLEDLDFYLTDDTGERHRASDRPRERNGASHRPGESTSFPQEPAASALPLTEDRPSPREALDLLLGTQGWRRFAELSLDEITAQTASEGDNHQVSGFTLPPGGSRGTSGEGDSQVNHETRSPSPAATASDPPKGRVKEGESASEGTTEDDEELQAAITQLVALQGQTSVPLTHDDLTDHQSDYRQAMGEFAAAREQQMNQAGQIVLTGGIALFAVLSLLIMVRRLRDARLWIPAMALTSVCIVLGGSWLNAKVDPDLPTNVPAYPSLSDLDMEKSHLAKVANSERWARYNALNEISVDIDELETELAGVDEGEPMAMPGADFDDFAIGDMQRPGQGQQGGQAAGEGKDLLGRLAGDGKWMVEGLRRQVQFREEKAQVIRGGIEFKDEWNRELNNPLPGGGPGYSGGGGFRHDGRYGLGWYYTPLATNGRWSEKDLRSREISLEKLLKEIRLPVREYAHLHRVVDPEVRTDFTETIYWHPLLIADENGEATLKFELADSLVEYRVLADVHGAGRIGSGESSVVSRIPFSVEPKLPMELTRGDRLDLPVALRNESDGDLSVELSITAGWLGLSREERTTNPQEPNAGGSPLVPPGSTPATPPFNLDGDTQRTIELAAGSAHREYFGLDVVGSLGETSVEIRGVSSALSDGNRQSIRVVPPGFPVSESYAGELEGDSTLVIPMPEGWIDDSLSVTLSAFPTSLADLQQGLDSILREPYGCFEQTSTSNYPNVMTLRYMQENDIADPAMTRKAKQLLEKGYKKLISFECDKKGYEWFGADPGHEALTAYGLMQYVDMQHVWEGDENFEQMLERTRQWLLDRRDGNGGFKRNSKALDSFGRAPQEITDAYITWALSEAEQEGIETEVDYAIQLATDSEDPYLIALAASSAINTGKKDAGADLLDKLVKYQQEDGHLVAVAGTITRSGGVSAQVETTALATLAWLKEARMAAHANKAVEWIGKHRQGSGGWGSTQATILALKALIEHTRQNRRTLNAGTLSVKSGDEEVGKTDFTAGEQNAITLEGLAAHIRPGDNELTISLSGDNKMPYVLDVFYRTEKPVSDDACPVRIEQSLSAEKATAGEMVQLAVKLENTSGKGQPMTIAVIGLPAGLSPRSEQLEDLKGAGVFDYYEQNARELVLYWRSLSPDVKGDAAIEMNFDLIAEIPGRFTAPASRAYLYYTAESKHWVDPVKVEIER